MVDVGHIHDQLLRIFQIMPDALDHDESQAVHIDPATGVVDVYGTVILRNPNHTQLHSPLPVKFGHVRRNFNISFSKQYDLLNLINFPHTVDGDFRVGAPNLISLEGAPRYVHGVCALFSDSLKSLEHLPDTYGKLRLHYTPHLHMLRLVDEGPVGWMYSAMYGGIAGGMVATGIIEQYRSKGKAGALKAAAELIRAGFKENARW